ncbi:MAG: hypothetical protein MUP47_09175 [Phycisphaerae bacterium]|nr:hypothetical protein [Phycisphaerae bacterium]
MSVRRSILLLLIALAAWPAAGQVPAAQDPSASAATVDDLLRWAADPRTDAIRRDAFAAQAAERLHGQLQEALTKASTQPADVLERLKLELKLAETEGLLRGGPHARRVLDLQGLPRDRQRLAEYTDSALKRLRNLSREIDGKLVVWRGEYKLLVTAVPALEDLQAAVAYKTAWVALYRALAAEGGSERDALLAEAETLAQPFTGADPSAPGSGVRPAALLLVGIARRERAGHDEAAEALQAAASGGDGQLAAEARFQTARNLIEHGVHLVQAGEGQAAQRQWEAAGQAIAVYVTAAARDEGDRTGVDLRAALLKHALHQAQAAAAASAEARRDQEHQAQGALAEFAMTHPQAVADGHFLAAVAEKYRCAQDRGALNAVVLLALAVGRRGEAASAPEADESAAMLTRILGGGDEVSKALRPAALWYLATLEASRQNHRRSAELFAELAGEYGDSAFARPAAVNAVVCYNNLLNAPGQPVDQDVRNDFIAALEALLACWGREGDVAGWYFDLGWQYEKLAETASDPTRAALLDKAVEAYQALPNADPRHPQAARRALDVQARRVLEGPPDAPSRAYEAQRLVQALLACAAQAQSASTADAVQTGAWAELTAARLLVDVLGRRDEGLALLAELPSRWAGASVLGEALEFHAAKLLEGGRVEEAIDAVERLGQDRPAQALDLGWRLLADMSEHRTTADPSTAWVQGRVRLAEYCYRRCDPSAQAERAAFGQAYGEALLDAGRPGEALELLLASSAAAEAQAARQREQIDAELAERLAAVEAARTDGGALRALVGELMCELAAAGVRPQDSRDGQAVRDVLVELDGSLSPGRQRGLVEQLVSALRDGYRHVAQAKKEALAARGDILLALARAYADLGRNDEAAELYGRLAEGLDPVNDPAAYWQAELGYCRCILASRREDERAMKSLAVRIAQLRVRDPQLGGLGEQFAAVQLQAGPADR